MQLLFDESDDGTISDDFSSMESPDSSPPQSSSTAEPASGVNEVDGIDGSGIGAIDSRSNGSVPENSNTIGQPLLETEALSFSFSYYMSPDSTSPTPSSTAENSEMDTPSITTSHSPSSAPTTLCPDNKSYRVPFNDQLGCNVLQGVNYYEWAPFLSEVDLIEMLEEYANTCGIQCGSPYMKTNFL